MVSAEVVLDLEEFAQPALAVEFAETLSLTWAEQREGIRDGSIGPQLLYKLLDSFASVVLTDFED